MELHRGDEGPAKAPGRRSLPANTQAGTPSSQINIEVAASATGSARLIFDGSSFLRKSVAVTLTGSSQAIGTATMQSGDVDDSGEVDAVDIDLVIAGFGGVDE